MAETLLPGDKVIVLKDRVIGNYGINDIVAFRHNIESPTVFLKRLIADEGDTLFATPGGLRVKNILIPHDSVVNLLIDINTESKNLGEDYSSYFYYLINNTTSVSGKNVSWTEKYIVVPEDHYFFAGDNYYESMDSRFWGFIHQNQIIGKVMVTF